MPLIRVNHADPLSPEALASLLRGLTDAYASATGSDPAKVQVLVERVPAENWSVGGTSLAARRAGTAATAGSQA